MFEVRPRLHSEKPRRLADKAKKVTRTFRISKELDNILRKEAEKQGISVNVLMNLILRRYALFDRFAKEANCVSLTKRAFRKIIEGIPLEHLALAGEDTGSKDLQNIVGMLGLPLNYDSFSFLVTRYFGGSDCVMWFRCYRHLHENCEVFNLQHDLGREWSVYLEKYLVSSMNTLKIDYETRIYDYALNINIRQPHLC